MSTLAAARADNFYLAKNYDPSKVKPKKSDNPHEKPFKVVDGQRVGGSKVRYETPFHVRCLGCSNMVAKGVRFNSIKTWVDNFHSTKIYEFRMKCPHCPQKFVARTDPQNCDYVYVSGAKRIFQTSDCTDESRIRDEAVQQRIREDPLFRLQNETKDKETYGSAGQMIVLLQDMKDRAEDDYEINRQLRREARMVRDEIKENEKQKRRLNLHTIDLLPETESDRRMAAKVHFKTKHIKRQDGATSSCKPKTDRERLKERLRQMDPRFREKLQSQVKKMNQHCSSLPLKK